jgi:hypothetical protein
MNEPVKAGVTIDKRYASDQSKSIPAAVSLGPHCRAIPPRVDTQHDRTALAGAKKRIAARPPTTKPEAIEELRRFVRARLEKFLVPADLLDDVSFERWLSTRNYPEVRKQELRDAYASIRSWQDPLNFKVKCHVKDEAYLDVKHARGIYSRSDLAKVLLGPYAALMEKIVYSEAEFVKHIPVRDRPTYISERLGKALSYIITDYTAMESCHVQPSTDVLETQLVDYLLEFVYLSDDIRELLAKIINGINNCAFKWFTMKVRGLMSGEMTTSLFNGFANREMMLFTMARRHFGYVPASAASPGSPCTASTQELVDYASTLKMVVEGDDGLTSLFHLEDEPSADDFAELGYKIKIIKVDNLTEASFCGIVFDPEECITITDPIYAMAQFGWTNQYYRRSNEKMRKTLLRARSLALLHQYPGCPIIQSMANYGLRVTAGFDVLHYIKNAADLGVWQRGKYLAAYNFFNESSDGAVPYVDKLKDKTKETGIRTRDLVEKLFGIPIQQQIFIEEYFDAKNDLEMIENPFIDQLFPAIWGEIYTLYSEQVFRTDEQLDFPLYIYGEHKDHVPSTSPD